MLNFIIKAIIVIIFSKSLIAKDINKTLDEIEIYFNSLNEFSASFIQESENEIQEGYIYKNDKRIRIDYVFPTKIIIILDQNKAMFFNQDLLEVEFFNPKKTVAKIVFDIFNNGFVNNFDRYEVEDNYIRFYVDFNNDDLSYYVEIVFETKPLQIRLVNIKSEATNFSFGLRDHNFNNNFSKNFFSMANPLLK